MRLTLALMLAAACVVAAVSGLPGSAWARDPPIGKLVATGASPDAVRWQIRAQRDAPDSVTMEFSFAAPGFQDAGYFISLPYPLPSRFTLMAMSGSDLDPSGEQD